MIRAFSVFLLYGKYAGASGLSNIQIQIQIKTSFTKIKLQLLERSFPPITGSLFHC